MKWLRHLTILGLVIFSSCATKGWVRDYMNQNLSDMDLKISQELNSLGDSIRVLRDSLSEAKVALNSLKERVEVLEDSLKTITTLNYRIRTMEFTFDSLASFVDSLSMRQTLIELIPLIHLRDVLDEYIKNFPEAEDSAHINSKKSKKEKKR